MLEDEPDIFSIAVDADDYAETAAGDVPAVDRTYQSAEDFAKVKASYVAKHDDGGHREELYKQIPALQSGEPAQYRLDKRQQALVGYAVGELYYDHQYAEALILLDQIEATCHVDERLLKSMRKWRQQCKNKG